MGSTSPYRLDKRVDTEGKSSAISINDTTTVTISNGVYMLCGINALAKICTNTHTQITVLEANSSYIVFYSTLHIYTS